MSNLAQRALTGTVFVLAIVAAIIFKSWIFHLVFGSIAVLGLHEFYTLFKGSKFSPHATFGLISGIFIYSFGVLSIYKPELLNWLIGGLLLSFPVFAFAELYRKKKTPFENIGLTVLGLVYIILPLLLLNFSIEFSESTFTITNFWPVLSIFILVWCSDTFAYLVGRKFGKHKLFERISPKKSWEGFFGGLLFSLLAGILIAYFIEAPFYQYIIYAAVISVFGTLGDLIESMLKRSLAIKDSGTILPGHGGILDRFDAVLFVIPILYFLNQFVFLS